MTDESTNPTLQAWLEAFLSEHGAVAGTVHLLQGDVLRLAAHVNIPPPVVAITGEIPRGKGMAGLAWERAEPVQTCNLKTDDSGDVRPGAKAVNAQAAVALPVCAKAGALRAVVGLAFMHENELPAAKLEAYQRSADALPEA